MHTHKTSNATASEQYKLLNVICELLHEKNRIASPETTSGGYETLFLNVDLKKVLVLVLAI